MNGTKIEPGPPTKFATELVADVKTILEAEGYTIVEDLVYDYGLTRHLLVKKNGVESVLPVIEVFYESDEEGNAVDGKVETVSLVDSPFWRKKILALRKQREIAKNEQTGA